jgi:hypothetical protein
LHYSILQKTTFRCKVTQSSLRVIYLTIMNFHQGFVLKLIAFASCHLWIVWKLLSQIHWISIFPFFRDNPLPFRLFSFLEHLRSRHGRLIILWWLFFRINSLCHNIRRPTINHLSFRFDNIMVVRKQLLCPAAITCKIT